MPTAKQTPIADWLRSTRERQLREDGEPWSQDDFLRELEKSSGWRLHRPNLSAYETGRSTPRGVNLARLVRFWEERGEPGPDLTPPAPVLSLEERGVLAAERQAAAAERQADLAPAILALTAEMAKWRDERVAMQRRIVALEARLGLDPGADVDPEMAAWGQAHAGSRSQRPAGHPAR